MPAAAPPTIIFPSRATRSAVCLSLKSISLTSLTWNLCPHEGHVLTNVPTLDMGSYSPKELLSSSIHLFGSVPSQIGSKGCPKQVDGTVKRNRRQSTVGLRRNLELGLIAVILVAVAVGFFFTPVAPTQIPTRCAGQYSACPLTIESGQGSPSYALFGFGLVYVPNLGCTGFLTQRLSTSLTYMPPQAAASSAHLQCP